MKNIIAPSLFIIGIVCICLFFSPAYSINYYGDPVPEQKIFYSRHHLLSQSTAIHFNLGAYLGCTSFYFKNYKK